MEIGFVWSVVLVLVVIIILLDLLLRLELLTLAAVRNLLDLAHEFVHVNFVVEFCMRFF